jgi:dipeptidyl aminopeptidase/acylaminoacyl peptidase
MKFRCVLFFIAMLFQRSVAKAQDGKLVEQKPYAIHDTIVKRLQSIDTMATQIPKSVDFYHITYLSDGLKVKGYMAIPKAAGKYPCVIFNRGGSGEFSAITDEIFYRLLGRLAANGYIVVGSQYRGNGGSEGKEEFGGSDVNDVLNLIPFLSNIQEADTSRIGMFGWSRGGMQTYLTLTRTNRIKAAVVGSGLADLARALETRPELDSTWAQFIPNYDTKKKEELAKRSAVRFAGKICKTTPILILQGTADWRVPADQVLELVSVFYKNKQPFRFILYEGGQHSLVEHRNNYYSQLVEWFNNYLRDGKSWPDLNPHGN